MPEDWNCGFSQSSAAINTEEHTMKAADLIFDWNRLHPASLAARGPVLLNDETLRDGLQSPSVLNPSIEAKIKILHLMETLGIHSVNLGLPGAGLHARRDAEYLANEIVRNRMKIRANCSARTHSDDIRAVADIAQSTGLDIEVGMFLGSSPIRRYAENWTDDFLLSTTETAVKRGVSLGLAVAYVTEDTTRCDPAMIKRLYSTAISCGARSIVVCDTVGHATPLGAYALIRFLREEVIALCGQSIRLDWHGHSDRGLAVANSIAALLAGADCVHGCALGLGERVGNTPMDLMLVNLKLMGFSPWVHQDLTSLRRYCLEVSQATGVAIPANYPVVGRDAFRTATGVHAAAIIKAFNKGDPELANLVYSGVPSHDFGLEQVIEIGPSSGRSNVVYWLQQRGIPPEASTVDRIYQFAKSSDHTLSEPEILEWVCTRAAAAPC
jgi:2-isopropylmalate synthase